MGYMSTGMIWQTESLSTESTERLGEMFGVRLKGSAVIELVADLGGGKTTFVKGLARGLGCRSTIQSPTFMISRKYSCGGGLSLHHYDLFRLGEAGVISNEIAESVADSQVVTVIEWAEVATKSLPKHRYKVEFKPSHDNVDTRTITIHYPSSANIQIEEIENDWVG
jgi:tRNA threonylcarbamoyladenosine biosynthesis protein TsaE